MKFLLTSLLAIGCSYGQYVTIQSSDTPAGSVGQLNLKPAARAGAGVPGGTCVAGVDFYVDTNTTLLYQCPTTNTWVVAKASFVPNAQTGTTYAITGANCGEFITFSNASAIAVSLPATPLPSSCTILAKNIGAGDATFTPLSGTISGAASIVLSLGEFAVITSNGTNAEAASNRIVAGSNVTVTKARVGATIAATGEVTAAQLQSGADLYCRSTTGNDTYTCTLAPDLTAYTTGGCVLLNADTANTGAATINIDALGAKSILNKKAAALLDGDIPANVPRTICYDGTQFISQANGGIQPVTGGGTGSATAAAARGALGVTYPITWTPPGGINPADATTYYLCWGNMNFQTTENGGCKFPVPIAGTVTELQFTEYNETTAGSTENVTVTMRLNGADTAITGTMTWSAATSTVTIGSFTGSIAVVKGDLLGVKILTPTWVAQNPISARGSVAITVRTDQ